MRIPENVCVHIQGDARWQNLITIEKMMRTPKCPQCGGPLCIMPPEYRQLPPLGNVIILSCAHRALAESSLDDVPYDDGCIEVHFTYHHSYHHSNEWEQFGEYIFTKVIAAPEPDEAIRMVEVEGMM